MAAQLTIRKGIQTKKISQYAWELLSDKNGWELAESSDQIVVNEVSSRGNSAKVVDAGIVTNEAEEVKSQVVTNEEEPVVDPNASVSNEAKENFIATATAAEIKIGVLKDYLDINDVKYKQKESKESLIEKLADFMGNDIEKLKSEFSI